MVMPVMNIGEMLVRMHQRIMNVRVSMRRGRIAARCVRVLVMLVVNVAMRVFQGFVRM